MTTKDDEYALLRSAALQNAASIRLARERAEQRQEAYWAEAQRLSHTGSFGWKVATGEIVWSEETFRIFQLDRATQPTVERVLQSTHPQDAAFLKQTIERASQDGKDFEHEFRLAMPDGRVKHVRVVAHASSDASGELEFVGAVMDVTEQRRARAALAGEKQLLEMIARGDSRAAILDALCRLVEELSSGSLSSILLLDPEANRLRHGAAPSLPVAYTEAIDGIVIGPSVGSCGTAAYRGEPVMVRDIAADPLWADFRDLALAHGLRACWSTPVRSSDGKVLGTFAIYYREPRSPAGQEQSLIERVTHLASIAIEREQAEEALREQASLLDLTHDTVFVRDMNNVITYWNRGAEERYGWTRQETVGKVSHKLLQTVFPEPLDEINAELLRVDRWEGELIHARRDGTSIVVASRWALQRDAARNPAAILETSNDITERKRWRSLTEALPQLVWAARPDGACDYFSTQWTEYTGVAETDLLGWRWMEALHPDDRENTRRSWADSVAGRGDYDVEYRVRRHDGRYDWFKTRGTPIRDSEGRIIKWFGTCTDITDQKRAEQALYRSEQELRRARDQLEMKVAERTSELQRSEARYRNIFQTVGVSIWEEDFSQLKAALDELRDSGVDDFRRYFAANPEFVQRAISMVRVVNVNDVTLKLFAAGTKDELLASLDRIFVPETREVFVGELVALAEGRTFFEAETVLQTFKGTRLSVLFTITFPQPSAHARYDGVLVTITDVTEQRAREREREEMQRQLQQAAKMEAIGRLAGGIAHDFNNILGAIMGYGELAQKNLEGRAVRRHVDQVMQAGARGKGLVERILAFSRSGLGERVPVHVQSVVEEALEILAASLSTGVRLEKRLDAGDTAVVGDATQLHQVAMNLCTNALQAMDQGGVLTVALEKVALPEGRRLSHGTLASGDYVRLCVGDTGSGIPPPVLERMFDPFFTTKRVGDGTGLGLSLVHGIVADFGGAIDVTTRAGAGTTFTVWLPSAGETPRPLAEAAGKLPRGNGETVMIVDDERALVALAEETLAALGYEPAGFDSSVAALEAFRAEPGRYDLVLTDETMPDLSGVELACEVRRTRPELPIVLMSGYSGAQLAERAHAVGVAEVLRKPLVARDIAEALGRALYSAA